MGLSQLSQPAMLDFLWILDCTSLTPYIVEEIYTLPAHVSQATYKMPQLPFCHFFLRQITMLLWLYLCWVTSLGGLGLC